MHWSGTYPRAAGTSSAKVVAGAASPPAPRRAIASALSCFGATALAPGTHALPSGGTVVGGSANGEIHLSGGNSLSVNQKVDKLIANWDSFAVAAGERVIFNQAEQ